MTDTNKVGVEPVAWLRKWAFDKEKPAKVKNENGRLAWPGKFKLLPVTEGQCLHDDIPLVPASELAELQAENQRLREALEHSFHVEHTFPNNEKCRCSQCAFVRLRDKALKGDV